jgi:flagellar motor switch protein FliG
MKDRMNRHGDVDQILFLLESSTPEQQHDLIQQMQKTDPAKAALIRTKLMTIDRVYSLDEESLGRILEDLDDRTFSLSLCGLDAELRKRALELVNNQKRKNALMLLKSTRTDNPEIQIAHRQIVQKARELENAGKIHLGAVRSTLKKAA